MTALGLAWFILATLPTSNLVAVTYLQFSDHWYILPGLGLTIALTDQLACLVRVRPGLRPLLQLSCAIVLAALAVVTPAQNRIWRTPLSLFGALAAFEPGSGRVQHNWAVALQEDGRIAEAIPVFERALALGYDDIKPHYQLALCYLATGRHEAAIKQLRDAARLAPRWAWPWQLMGRLQQRAGRPEEAAVSFRRAEALDPAGAQLEPGPRRE